MNWNILESSRLSVTFLYFSQERPLPRSYDYPISLNYLLQHVSFRRLGFRSQKHGLEQGKNGFGFWWPLRQWKWQVYLSPVFCEKTSFVMLRWKDSRNLLCEVIGVVAFLIFRLEGEWERGWFAFSPAGWSVRRTPELPCWDIWTKAARKTTRCKINMHKNTVNQMHSQPSIRFVFLLLTWSCHHVATIMYLLKCDVSFPKWEFGIAGGGQRRMAESLVYLEFTSVWLRPCCSFGMCFQGVIFWEKTCVLEVFKKLFEGILRASNFGTWGASVVRIS